ncbi:MAG: Rpn family recombination-promoting nuclease/putative transposase [Oscillospiraceae bacterium]|nr:Rpn family recombination-promoting nuclease/putative transposase [Oscillospiraceae bacterium]
MNIHDAADNSFKLIFGDNRLFADFLRDFIDIDILKDIRPEDVEDLSERLIPLFSESRDADTVKLVNLKGDAPFFVIAILEHESQVNFRACFKMLVYIALVLLDWEKGAEKERKGSSLLKGFKYPPVLPMIFYDGKAPWTAERNFFDRTHLNTAFEKYIPKFEYELINLNDYGEEELMGLGGALSYIFLIDKIRGGKEKDRIRRLPEDYVEKLRLQIPEDMAKLLADVILVLLNKSGYERFDAEQVASIVEKSDRKEYGGMFEAVIESMREEREIGREEGREEERKEAQAKVAEVREEARKERLQNAANLRRLGVSVETISQATGLSAELIGKL